MFKSKLLLSLLLSAGLVAAAEAGTWSAGVKNREDVRVTPQQNKPAVALSYGYANAGANTSQTCTSGATYLYYTVVYPQGLLFAGSMKFWKQTCN